MFDKGVFLTMRCAQCGSPLAPARKSCPRCGATIAEGQSPAPSRGLQDAWSQQPNTFPVQERSTTAGVGGMYVGVEAPQQEWGGYVSPNSWNAQGVVSVQQIPVSQQSTHNPYSNTLEQYPAPQAVSSGNHNISASSQEPFLPTPRPSKSNANGRSTRLGFMVSALCVITSGLILIFVYFMSMSLPPDGQSTTDAAGNGTPSVRSSPTPTPTPPGASHTPGFPGQAYIDNVQLARSVDSRAQPVQVMTNFKVNQRMYVTFDIHTEGHGGTVCLLWFLNTKQFNNFALPVGPTVPNGYSYTNVPSVPGSGYVELYWGHIPSCTDPNKQLAQRVNFTVSA